MAERSFIIWEVDKRPVHRDEVKFPRIWGRKSLWEKFSRTSINNNKEQEFFFSDFY